LYALNIIGGALIQTTVSDILVYVQDSRIVLNRVFFSPSLFEKVYNMCDDKLYVLHTHFE